MKMMMNEDPKYKKYDIGRFTYGGPNISKFAEANLKIGSFCAIAAEVKFLVGGEHRIDWVTTYPFNAILEEFDSIKGHPTAKGDIVIGNDVWIGYGATILSGVKIGSGSVIGARAVVTKDIPPYSIAVGSPIKVAKKRFDDEIIDKLLKIKWWDWPLDKIKKNVPLLLNDNIKAFVDKHYEA